MIWVGLIIVILTFAGIIMHYDTRLCLMLGGFLMCVLSGTAAAAVPAYCASLINGNVVTYTVISMGYAAIMSSTGMTDHLIYALLGPLSKAKAILVPGSVIVTWIIAAGLGSAATVGSVAGSLLIPIMVNLGVHPSTAAAAVLAGTSAIGPLLNPAGAFTLLALAADPTGQAKGETMVSLSMLPGIITLIGSAFVIMIMGKILHGRDAKKEVTAEEKAAAEAAMLKAASFKVNPVYAVMPIVPLAIVLIACFTPLLDSAVFTVPVAMYIGLVLTILLNVKDYKKIITQFFKGQGQSFDSVITLMACAAVFTAGMSNIGITNALLELMKNNPSIASIGATFGPMAIGAISGSGNAATIAFINSVLPSAEELGYEFHHLGLVCQFSGNWGRGMSPVAAVTIIVARIAGVDPMDVVKHTIPMSILVGLVWMIMLL